MTILICDFTGIVQADRPRATNRWTMRRVKPALEVGFGVSGGRGAPPAGAGVPARRSRGPGPSGSVGSGTAWSPGEKSLRRLSCPVALRPPAGGISPSACLVMVGLWSMHRGSWVLCALLVACGRHAPAPAEGSSRPSTSAVELAEAGPGSKCASAMPAQPDPAALCGRIDAGADASSSFPADPVVRSFYLEFSRTLIVAGRSPADKEIRLDYTAAYTLTSIDLSGTERGIERRDRALAFAAADYAVRRIVPTVLEDAGDATDATRLRCRSPIRDERTAQEAAETLVALSKDLFAKAFGPPTALDAGSGAGGALPGFVADCSKSPASAAQPPDALLPPPVVNPDEAAAHYAAACLGSGLRLVKDGKRLADFGVELTCRMVHLARSATPPL
jgi:hypothetical protein